MSSMNFEIENFNRNRRFKAKRKKYKLTTLSYLTIMIFFIIILLTLLNAPLDTNKALDNNSMSEHIIRMEHIPQLPELPNGCEVTSLAMVLKYYGFNVSKEDLSNIYLPKKDFKIIDGERYGADPEMFYAGNPARKDGFYCFTTPIVTAANNFLSNQDSKLKAYDITGATYEELQGYINDNKPIIIWTHTNGVEAKFSDKFDWKIFDTNKMYKPYSNLHCVVLSGFSDKGDEKKDELYINDPMRAKFGIFNNDNKDKYLNCDYDIIQSYYNMGSRAVVIK